MIEAKRTPLFDRKRIDLGVAAPRAGVKGS
jgi:hypothetical protein